MSLLKTVTIIGSLTFILVGPIQANTINKKHGVNEAKKITKTFVKNLKSELKKAMVSGGPLKALEVCNTKAMPITAQVAKDYNVNLSRVSLKNRNPNNAPNTWQKAILKDFDIRAAKGESVKKMAYSEIVKLNNKKQFRFMKAMPTGAGCLVCHGKNIAPAVKEKLASLYPNDKATGYEKGQVRGAIVIIKDLD